ncbi:MAG: aldehyde dehydrogenase family protein [Bdellovibrionales bacterium]|nr:aldehyde dehydrogenase family protein [Bdellovibrionales bacterium]
MEQLNVVAPYSGEVLGTFPLMGKEEVLDRLATAYQLYCDHSLWPPLHERIAILERAAQLISSRRQELALMAAKEGGKPLKDSLVEIDRAVNGIKVGVAESYHLKGSQIPMGQSRASEGRLAFTAIYPRGVVFAVSAFNHPFNLIIHQVIPAIMAGCPVLVKPARRTPISCDNLLQILYEAGLPPQWCQMILCQRSVTEQVVADSRVAFLSFIGSEEVGWRLRSMLAPGASCALEHGGVAPVIVDASGDWQRGAPLLVKGGFYHAGQVCVSVQRIFVDQQIVTSFTNLMLELTAKLQVGDPASPDSDLGPLITLQELERVEQWVEEAVASGGELLCGGQRIGDRCYAPTIILNPDQQCRLSREEVFGPVIAIYTYQQIDQAVKMANDLNFSFQAAVITNDLNCGLKLFDQLDAQAVMINDHTAFRVDWMPFGGAQRSGIGVGGIGPTMREMSVEKMLVFNQS